MYINPETADLLVAYSLTVFNDCNSSTIVVSFRNAAYLWKRYDDRCFTNTPLFLINVNNENGSYVYHV